MRIAFPPEGKPAAAVLAEIEAMKGGDADWRGGRVPLYVFKANDDVDALGRQAFNAFFAENALGAKRAFLSLGRMEREVVEMALDLFQAPPNAAGFMTTGGTEGIIMAVEAARNFARATGRIRRGDSASIVLPETAHPAFEKAARLMDLEPRRVAVGSDFRADPAAMAAAIDGSTFMVVASAPCFPFGVIDPIGAVAALAHARGLWMHVDACVGGYLAPFAKANGRLIPDFDFSVAGVTSLSADLHKFGFTPKPASTVFYRTAEHAAHHGFSADVWPNGRFTTSTIVGTRPGGAVAAAWATLRHLGHDGYRSIARDLMAMIDRYRSGIAAIPGLHVIGDPHLSIVAVGSDQVDVFRVAEVMGERGWVPGLVQRPKGLHRMMSLLHEPSLESYLADLTDAVTRVRREGGEAHIKATY